MSKSRVVFCFIIGLISLYRHQSKATADRLFSNMTYQTTAPYIAEKVTLVNGYRVVWNGRLHMSLSYEGRYVYGDFNQDGLRDAAVIIVENDGGNACWYKLAFLINDGERLVHKASRTLDDRAVINSLKEDNGKVVVDMFVHQDGDCMAGPTKRVKHVYEFNGPDIRLTS